MRFSATSSASVSSDCPKVEHLLDRPRSAERRDAVVHDNHGLGRAESDPVDAATRSASTAMIRGALLRS